METEVKIPIDQKKLEQLVSILGTPNYFKQDNVIYKLENGILRTRFEQGKTIVTFKGRNTGLEYNVREEIEFCVDCKNFGYANEFFRRLGFKETLRYTKERANFRLNRCLISLDRLSNGQNYIEIEGNGEDIEINLEHLSLDRRDFESKSYLEILCPESII